MNSKKIKELLKSGSLILKNQKEASILLMHILQYDQIELILHENDIVDKKIEQNYQELIKRRVEGEPIEYITNHVSFYSEKFFIKKGALIPRPETELLVDLAIKTIKDNNYKNIAEIGCGSGIISVMIAKYIKNINIISTDISKEAIKIAQINIDKFKLTKNIKLVNTNYLDGIYDKFDMIVSNPPYIKNGYKLDKSLYYEPQNALFGGEVGDEILKDIIDIWYQKGAKHLICEMGYDQKESIKKYAQSFKSINIEFYKDLANFDRGFICRRV